MPRGTALRQRRHVERHAGRSSGLPAWRYEWRITSTGTVKNPTGPSTAPVTRTATAIVPVVIPTRRRRARRAPELPLLGRPTCGQNSVHVRAPLYVTRDLHLESTAAVDGAAQKVAVGRDLYLKNAAEPDRSHGRTTAGRRGPRGAPVLVEGTGAAHVRTHDRPVGRRRDLRDDPRQRHPPGPPPFISYTPKLTCCAPYGGTHRSRRHPPPRQSEQHGLLVPERRTRAVLALHDYDRHAAEFRHGSGVPDNSINWSATPAQ